MRILDDAENVVERVSHCGYENATPDLLHVGTFLCAVILKLLIIWASAFSSLH